MIKEKILVINPGSTSTKIAVYEGEAPLFEETLRHSAEELEKFPQVIDQYEFRMREILKVCKTQNVDLNDLDAVIGRGGLCKPVESGTYSVTKELLDDLKKGVQGQHASNLGGVIADAIHRELNIPAFIADPPAVDEFEDLARFSGIKDIERNSLLHALNIKATARKAMKEKEKSLDEVNLIVTHLGGGITVTAMRKNRMINVNNGIGEGPFTPERSGGLPLTQFLDLCFSGKYTRDELKKLLAGKGGLVSYLNTNDSYDVELRAEKGEPEARLIFEAMGYQIAEEIGARATNLFGKVDYIILTGGLARAKILVEWIEERVGFIAPVLIYPGENELEALAHSALRVLRNEEKPKDY